MYRYKSEKRIDIQKGGKSSQHIVDDLPPRLLTLIPYPHRITVEFLYIDQFQLCHIILHRKSVNRNHHVTDNVWFLHITFYLHKQGIRCLHRSFQFS